MHNYFRYQLNSHRLGRRPDPVPSAAKRGGVVELPLPALVVLGSHSLRMFANFFGISYPRPRPHIYHVCLPNQAVFYPLPPVDMDVLYEWSLFSQTSLFLLLLSLSLSSSLSLPLSLSHGKKPLGAMDVPPTQISAAGLSFWKRSNVKSLSGLPSS